MKKDLVQELRETFDYHEDGYLIRRKNGKPCGQRANRPDGYVQVWVGKRPMRAHRIIFAIVHGRTPEGEIDHLNSIRSDNRIENLRDVSASENSHNYKMPKTNTSGFQGVRWHAQAQKWQAEIRVNRRYIYLGIYEDFEDAVEARKIAKIRFHPSSPEAARFIRELFPC